MQAATEIETMMSPAIKHAWAGPRGHSGLSMVCRPSRAAFRRVTEAIMAQKDVSNR